jgi:hypothetical protein
MVTTGEIFRVDEKIHAMDLIEWKIGAKVSSGYGWIRGKLNSELL